MFKNKKINLNPSESYEVVSFCSEFLKICGLFPIKVIKNEFNQHQISLSKIGLILTASHFSLYFLTLFEFLFTSQSIAVSRYNATLTLMMECLKFTIIFSTIYQIFRRHKKYLTKLERLQKILNELEIDLKPELKRIKIILVISLILLVFYLSIGICIYSFNINKLLTAKSILTRVYVCAVVSYFAVVITILKMGFDACNTFLEKM